jgi:ABC-type branched-subunit amino acid transport system permease subunit
MTVGLALAMLAASGIVGGIAGWLLSAYWWDWPPEDLMTCCPPHEDKSFVIWLYSFIGVVTGLFIGAFLVVLAGVWLDIRHRRLLARS